MSSDLNHTQRLSLASRQGICIGLSALGCRCLNLSREPRAQSREHQSDTPNPDEEPTMPKQKESLQKLYLEQLRDLFSAEDQILEALPKMQKQTTHAELRRAFQEHYQQTE